ncbi:hypothetical protein FACS189440_06810 [Bacteroidia bacterium]|nr:hypothetical protein FACS189440_06810 [Bacteroidia bacterium]
MENKVLNIAEYNPVSSDLFFFDNNVWMFLFCPLGEHQYHKQQLYSRFLQEVLAVNAPIFINDLVLSEFSNTYFRLDFHQFALQQNRPVVYKKNYVGTSRYQRIASDIRHAIDDILQIARHSDQSINTLGLTNVLSNIEHIDFNDSFYIEQAKAGNWKIVTDDRDFQKVAHQIPIITKMD